MHGRPAAQARGAGLLSAQDLPDTQDITDDGLLSAQGLPSQHELADFSLLPAQTLPDTQVGCKILLCSVWSNSGPEFCWRAVMAKFKRQACQAKRRSVQSCAGPGDVRPAQYSPHHQTTAPHGMCCACMYTAPPE